MMVDDVLAGLIVAAVTAVVGWLYTCGLLVDWLSGVSVVFDPEMAKARKDSAQSSGELLRMVLRDQSRFGRHRGQFGRFRTLRQATVWSPRVERMFSKPRMYMTRWPCRVLKRHGLAPRALVRATEGVRRLFENNVILGEEDGNPFAWRRRRFVNYRHTICAALILFEQKGWEEQTKAVVGAMLSRGEEWRQRGGWLHSDAEPDSADLYSTLYAVQLLDAVAGCGDVWTALAEAAEAALQQSLVYLENEWKQNGWKYRTLSAEESFPLAFVEISDVLRRRRPHLHEKVVDRLLLHRNPAGGLQAEYLKRVREQSDVSVECLLARFAYAIYRARLPRSDWEPLRDAAFAGEIGSLTAVEAAFLLDLEASSLVSSAERSDSDECLGDLGT